MNQEVGEDTSDKPFFKRFWWLFVISFILILGAVFFVIKTKDDSKSYTVSDQQENRNSENKPDDLPACPAKLAGVLTKPMIDPKETSAVLPMGFVNGQGHNLPIAIVSFVANNKGLADAPVIPVYSPGDIQVYEMIKHEVRNLKTRELETTEYTFYANVCKGLTLWFTSIFELTPELQKIYDEAPNKMRDESDVNVEYRAVNERAQVNFKLKPGEQIGTTGGHGPMEGLEIITINKNAPAKNSFDSSYYINPSWVTNEMCFLDLYDGELKEFYYNKLGAYETNHGNSAKSGPEFIPRTKEPRCGEVVQNIAGTIQGDWFAGRPKEGEILEAAGKTLSFIHQNIYPDIAIISIGGAFMKTGEVRFDPQNSGTINREPSEVKADGNIYCYDIAKSRFKFGDFRGKILAQLIDDRHLKVENQPGSCGAGEAFSKPFDYER